MKLKQLVLGISVSMVMPIISFAQSRLQGGLSPIKEPNLFTSCSAGIKDLTGMLEWVGGCLVGKGTIMLIMAIALVIFMGGAVRYIWMAGQGSADYAKKLRDFLIWSLIALFVMLSVWGIVYFIGATLGIGQGGNAPLPQFSTVK
jgi:hypothetical protein